MKHCPVCNTKYADRYRFCREDGTALLEDPVSMSPEGPGLGQAVAFQGCEPVQDSVLSENIPAALETLSSTVKYCPSCNSEYENRYSFCRLDGTALRGKPVPEPDLTEKQSKKIAGFRSSELADEVDTLRVSEPLPKSSLPLTKETSQEIANGQQSYSYSSAGIAVVPRDNLESPGVDAYSGEPKVTKQDPPSKPVDGKGFELLVQQEIKKAFRNAFVRTGVQIRSLQRTTEADLFVLLPRGVFLIECKNYCGKISGSLNYDQKQGEFWTCETPTGDSIQITSSGKNPADQALARFHTLHDLAKEAWGEANRPYIYPVLLFPDAADLAGITQMTVYPVKPSTADRVVATTLSKIVGYLANADSMVDQAGALKLIDFLGIPRSSLSGTWLDQPFKPEDRSPKQAFEQASSFPQEPKGAFAEDQYSFDEVPQTEQRAHGHPLTRGALVATAVVVIGVLFLFIIGRQIFYSGSTKLPDLTSRQEAPQPQPLEPAPPLVPVPEAEYSSLTLENSRDQEKAIPDPQYGKALPAGKIPPSKAQESPGASPTAEAKLDERPITGRRAEPGTYETIRPTYARTRPNDSADVVDEIGSGVRLNVVSSEGSWLIVRSKKRQATVYVKRDDAMFVSPNRPPRESFQEAEARWKKLDAEISAVLAQRGIAGVTVSFIGDTAFLKGQVKTDYERFLAEQVARSFPEVQHIHNGIWVVP